MHTCYSHSIYITFYLRGSFRPVFTRPIMNAKPQQGIKKNEDLQATLKNGQEKSGKPTLPAAFPVLETGSRKELQITWNDFPDRDQLQELYTSYKHVIIKPPMICCDFCRHRQSFITGGIKENTGNGSDREKAVSRRFLPDSEEKSYRHLYHIHIIKPQNAPFSCFFSSTRGSDVRKYFHVRISPGARIFHPFPQDRMRVNGRI